MRRKKEETIGPFTSGYKMDFLESGKKMVMVTEEVARKMVQAKKDAEMTEAVNRRPSFSDRTGHKEDLQKRKNSAIL